MKEIVFNIMVCVVCVIILAVLTFGTNKIKSAKCTAAEGQVILNTTNSRMTSCIITK